MKSFTPGGAGTRCPDGMRHVRFLSRGDALWFGAARIHHLTPPTMRLTVSASLALLVAITLPAHAQKKTHPVGSKATVASASAVADARAQWKSMMANVLQSAMDVPEDKYGFKPSPDVRSFGELFAHVAGAQSMFCALALGEKAPPEDAVRSTTKAGLVEALKQSNADCERAYAQSPEAAAANVDVFGEQHSRLYALMMNVTHDAEHYGNLVTYLRINGMVPPSSKPAR